MISPTCQMWINGFYFYRYVWVMTIVQDFLVVLLTALFKYIYINFIFSHLLWVECFVIYQNFNLRINSSSIFPISFYAEFGWQRQSIMREMSTDTIRVILQDPNKHIYSIVWKCINCQYFGEKIHSFTLLVLVHIHIYVLFVLRTFLYGL